MDGLNAKWMGAQAFGFASGITVTERDPALARWRQEYRDLFSFSFRLDSLRVEMGAREYFPLVIIKCQHLGVPCEWSRVGGGRCSHGIKWLVLGVTGLGQRASTGHHR